MEIIVCRHTKTDHNEARIYSGHIDIGLNKVGLQQSDTLAEQLVALDGPPIGAVLCSDLSRAAYLGKAIGQRANVIPVFTSALREVNIGLMAGVVREDAPVHFPDIRHRTDNRHFDFRDIGGENAADVIERHQTFLARAIQHLDSSGVQRIVVVGHGTALRLVFRDTFNLIEKLHEQGEYQIVSL